MQVCTRKSTGWKVFTTFWCMVLWCHNVWDVFSRGRSTFTRLHQWPGSATTASSIGERHSPSMSITVFTDYICKIDEPLLAGRYTCSTHFYTTLPGNSRFALNSSSNRCVLKLWQFDMLNMSDYSNAQAHCFVLCIDCRVIPTKRTRNVYYSVQNLTHLRTNGLLKHSWISDNPDFMTFCHETMLLTKCMTTQCLNGCCWQNKGISVGKQAANLLNHVSCYIYCCTCCPFH